MKEPKEKTRKKIQLIAGFCLVAVGLVSMIFFGGKGAWIAGLVVTLAGIRMAVYSFDRNMHGKSNGNCLETDGGMSYLRRLKKDVPEQCAPGVVRWNGLKAFGSSLLRAYFDESGFHRYIVFKKDDYVSYRKERLCINSADEREALSGFALCCEWLSVEDYFAEIFDCEERVLNDLKGQLLGYAEEALPPDLEYAETAKKHSGGVCIWGDRSGGSCDNVYFLRCVAYDAKDDALFLHFSDGAKCTIFSPEEISDTESVFSVRSASAAEWETFRYGESRSESAKIKLRYERTDSGEILVRETNGRETRERRVPLSEYVFRFQ